MHHMYADDASMQDSSDHIVVGKGNPPNKCKKRAGAKAVKAFERNSMGSDGNVSRDVATTFRAIRARANDLSQDRAGRSYSSKKLCFDFAEPSDHALQKLKWLGRYYQGRPGLAYKYKFAEE